MCFLQKLGKLFFIMKCGFFTLKSALNTKKQNRKKACRCLQCWVPVNITFLRAIMFRHCTKKWSFPLKILSVTVTKSAGNCGKLLIRSHLLKKSLMENFIFCAVWSNNQFYFISSVTKIVSHFLYLEELLSINEFGSFSIYVWLYSLST